jgi:hypothetical protein
MALAVLPPLGAACLAIGYFIALKISVNSRGGKGDVRFYWPTCSVITRAAGSPAYNVFLVAASVCAPALVATGALQARAVSGEERVQGIIVAVAAVVTAVGLFAAMLFPLDTWPRTHTVAGVIFFCGAPVYGWTASSLAVPGQPSWLRALRFAFMGATIVGNVLMFRGLAMVRDAAGEKRRGAAPTDGVEGAPIAKATQLQRQLEGMDWAGKGQALFGLMWLVVWASAAWDL